MLERIQKYFPMSRVLPLDSILLQLRSVKSPYELGFMESAGERHHHLLTRVVPSLLQEGISEAEMYGAVYHAMIRDGHQGVTRFNGFGIEMQIGQCSFGTDSLVPTNFDGPGGMLGMAACVPSGGNRDRKLCAGDLVFADTGFGYFGYHTDKTQIYAFAEMLPEKALRLHEECLELERAVQGMLKPRNIPSEIYAAVLEMTGPELSENFMGYQNRKVNFVGHGIGMVINECPVLAKGFDAPLEENMTFAVEPKCGVSGVGMVGVEDTYVVTPGGGRVLTGGGCGILLI
jgi:Xaa-Pro aminopeptidase